MEWNKCLRGCYVGKVNFILFILSRVFLGAVCICIYMYVRKYVFLYMFIDVVGYVLKCIFLLWDFE